MNDAVIVDSNVLIMMFSGKREIADALVRYQRVFVPATVCGEFYAGVQGGTARDRKAKDAFEKFLSNARVSVLPILQLTGEYYARVYNFVKAIGKMIPINDVWIAAAALETGAVLMTNDSHLLSLPLIRTCHM